MGSPDCSQETEDVFADDSEELQARKRPSFWRRRKFREVYLPVVACAMLLTAAIMLRLYERHKVALRDHLLGQPGCGTGLSKGQINPANFVSRRSSIAQ